MNANCTKFSLFDNVSKFASIGYGYSLFFKFLFNCKNIYLGARVLFILFLFIGLPEMAENYSGNKC